MASPDQVQAAISPALTDEGLLVDEVVITPAGKRSVLRISVDRDLGELPGGVADAPTAPLSLDEVAHATRAVSAVLDESDVMGQAPYVLEVSSPGVSRPLTLPRHFQRNIGRLLAVTPAEGEPVTGRLLRADGASATLAVGEAAEELVVAYADIRKAVVQVEFNRPGDDDESED